MNYVWNGQTAPTIIEIDKCKRYLKETDYIALKLAEADDNKKEVIRQLYKSEFAQREAMRDKINKLESELEDIINQE